MIVMWVCRNMSLTILDWSIPVTLAWYDNYYMYCLSYAFSNIYKMCRNQESCEAGEEGSSR